MMNAESNKNMYKVLFILCIVTDSSWGQVDFCESILTEGEIAEWVLPIGYNTRTFEGSEFNIVNNVSSYNPLCKYVSQKSNHAAKSMDDIIEDEINIPGDINSLLSANIEGIYCVISTTIATTLSLNSLQLPFAYLGLFDLVETTASTGFEIEERAENNICPYGQFRLYNRQDPPNVFEPICALVEFRMAMEGSAQYFLTYVPSNGGQINTSLLFALPFKTSSDVTVQCGFNTQKGVSPPTPPGDDLSGENTGGSTSNDSNDSVSPELIALIAVVALIFITGIVLLIVFIIWRKNRQRKKRTKKREAYIANGTEANEYDRYESVAVTLASQNIYQEETPQNRRPTYESINSLDLSSPYEEIPADVVNGEIEQTQGNDYTSMKDIHDESTPNGDVEKTAVNLDELYAKPQKRPSEKSTSNRDANVNSSTNRNSNENSRIVSEVGENATNFNELYAKPIKQKSVSTVDNNESFDTSKMDIEGEEIMDDDIISKSQESTSGINYQVSDENSQRMDSTDGFNEDAPKSTTNTAELDKSNGDLDKAETEQKPEYDAKHQKLQKIDSVLRMVENDAYLSD